MATEAPKAELYERYPVSSVALYNGVTVLHFLLGAAGIALGYGQSWVAYLAALVYLLFAFAQMYLIMPLTVCPNCTYYRLDGARCASAVNLVARRIAPAGDPVDFAKRAEGLLCHNNLYLAALVLPILAMIPALILNFSWVVLGLLLAVVGLLLLRFFVLFSRVACVHCQAKYECPNAAQTGVRDR